MLRLPLFLLATSAAAIPSSYLRPLERDLRDMETAIEALNAKAAGKGLRLEKTSKEPITVTVVHPADESVFFSVTLEGDFTVGALKAKIVTMKKDEWKASGYTAACYDTDKLNIGDENENLLSNTDILNDKQKVYLPKTCNVPSEVEKIRKKKWHPKKEFPELSAKKQRRLGIRHMSPWTPEMLASV